MSVTLTKETSLFKKDVIKDGINAASATANDYIDDISGSNQTGMVLHPASHSANNYMRLDSSEVSIYKGGTKIASYGDIITLYRLVSNSAVKTLEITNSGLYLYGSTTNTPDVSLTLNGLLLSKGGIQAGTPGINGFVYLSTEDYPLKNSSVTPPIAGLAVNGYTPTAAQTDGRTVDDAPWRQVIGTKFGVDRDGKLYAADAHIDGNIIARSLTISNGSNTVNAWDAINITGYTIEIETVDVVGSTTQVKLIPHLYHNGIEVVEPELIPSGFLWYENGVYFPSVDSEDGSIIATRPNTYRVTYEFADGDTDGATPIQPIVIDGDTTKYITDIDETGITIHPEVWSNESSYIQLDGTGMKLYNSSNTPIAQYGTITIVGATSGKHVYIDGNGIQLKNASTVLANFSSSVRIGPENSGHILINSGGIDLNAYSGSNIINMAHIGYSTTVTESGTGQFPYFTFGTRRSDITDIGGYSFVAGYANSSTGWADVTLGSSNKNYGNIVIGDGNIADNLLEDPYAADNHTSNTTHWSQCFIFGSSNEGVGSSFLLGSGNKGRRRYNVSNGVAVGHYNTVAYYGFALGRDNTSDGNTTVAIGYGNKAHGTYCIAMGENCETSTSTGMCAIGRNTYANIWSGDMAIGQYNVIRTSGSGYSFCIGNGHEDERSNCFEVQNNGTVYATAYNYLSDERIKTNFKDVSTLKQILMELEPIDYEWAKITHKGSKNVYDDKKRHIGLKAQHTLSIFEKYGYKNYGIVEEHDDYYSINYSEIIPMCVKVIQEQEERINSLENEIKQIKLLLAEGK